MENGRNKIIRVSDLIGKNKELLGSGHRYGEFKCYYKDHEHDEDFESMVSVDDPSIFRLGEQFSSYDELLDRLDEHSKMSYIHYWRRDSRTVDGAHMKTARSISTNLKYYSVKFACIYGGQKFLSRAKGKRASISRRTNCPSHITVRANKCGQSLEVISVCNHHNHPVNGEIYHRMPHDRRLPSHVKEDVLCIIKNGKLEDAEWINVEELQEINKDIHSKNLEEEKLDSGLLAGTIGSLTIGNMIIVLDLLRLGFNQKRVREYIEWETGKKLTNKDLHNLVAIDKRPKVLISEKRALHLEQILAIFEANKTYSKVITQRKKKSHRKSVSVSEDNNKNDDDDGIPSIRCEDGRHFSDSGAEPYTYIEETFDVSNEIEVSLEEEINIEGNFFFQNEESPADDIATLTVVSRGKESEISNESSGKMNEVILGDCDPSLETVNERTDNTKHNEECTNNIFIFDQRNGDNANLLEASVHNRAASSENDDAATVHNEKSVCNEDMAEITDIKIDRNKNFEVEVEVKVEEVIQDVVYFSEDEVPVSEEYEQDIVDSSNVDSEYMEMCCETCGRLHSDIHFDIYKLRSERDELLKETSLLREEKVRLVNELLCLKEGTKVQNNANENLEQSKGNVWIVVE